MLGSRWLVHANSSWPPTGQAGVDFSVQYFVDCVTEASRGCHGGSSYEAFALAHAMGAVDSSCIPYYAYNQNCTAHNTCRQNLNGTPPVHSSTVKPVRYFVGEYGIVTGHGVAAKEAAMMAEIYARGPVASCMACPAEFERYTAGENSNHARPNCNCRVRRHNL
eukprot:SAG31_NODE_1312_length_8861_cov_10.803127_2_plen_164_part_00